MNVKQEIRKCVEEKKVIIGTERTIKALKKGSLSKVFLAANTSADVVAEVNALANKAEVVVLKENNEELGTICKKPFFISVLGINNG